MERITPSKTNNSPMQHCGKTECANCQDKTETRKKPGAENKDTVADNIFRKYYEALLQGYSIDFFQTKHGQGGFHCT